MLLYSRRHRIARTHSFVQASAPRLFSCRSLSMIEIHERPFDHGINLGHSSQEVSVSTRPQSVQCLRQYLSRLYGAQHREQSSQVQSRRVQVLPRLSESEGTIDPFVRIIRSQQQPQAIEKHRRELRQCQRIASEQRMIERITDASAGTYG